MNDKSGGERRSSRQHGYQVQNAPEEFDKSPSHAIPIERRIREIEDLKDKLLNESINAREMQAIEN